MTWELAWRPCAEAKCGPRDEVIDLVWPAKFTPALTTDEQRGRAHEMAPERSRRLLLKLGPLILGDTKKLVIGTIGGSVTMGHKHLKRDYPALFAEGLREMLRKVAPAAEWRIESRNGAQGGTGSG